jgi:putative ATP-dependent endonuclease of OLD family
VERKAWDDSYPWGVANVAQARRPEPHRVSPFDPPETQAASIAEIMMTAVKDRFEGLKGLDGDGKPKPYQELLDRALALRTKLLEEADTDIKAVAEQVRGGIQSVFPGFTVEFDAKADSDLEKAINVLAMKPELRMGPEGGFLSAVDKQGSGARRTLLWNALRVVSERKRALTSSARPHVLLIDEPEICLHPNAVRDARDTLYALPKSGTWQVMVTTHSPVFIDLSRDNTKVVRVSRSEGGVVEGTTLFRASSAQLDDDDRTNLKLLNLCDPHVAEFFFGGRTIVVEGDTEYTAFSYVREQRPDKFKVTLPRTDGPPAKQGQESRWHRRGGSTRRSSRRRRSSSCSSRA